MSRRPDDIRMLSCAATALESEVIEEMKRLTGLTTDANLVRVALWNFADFLELDPPNTVFDVRIWGGQEGRDKHATPRLKSRRRAKVVIKGHQKPGPSHPWRLKPPER